MPSKQLLPELFNEFSSYTYKTSANGNISFSHPNGLKDDIVDAIMLANLARTKLAFSTSKIYIGGKKPQTQVYN
jgi:hypothetical protein